MSKRYLINTKRHFLRALMTGILNIGMWFYIYVAIMIFVSALLDFNTEELRVLKAIMKINNQQIRVFIYISCLWFLVSFVLLWSWKKYNYKKYGRLDRRQYPDETTEDEILALNLISSDIYEQLQNNRVTILETNPVRDINEKEGDME